MRIRSVILVAMLTCGGLAAWSCGQTTNKPTLAPDGSIDAADLARRYAPVLYLSSQRDVCDQTIDTDPYDPVDVGVFLSKNDVRLITNESFPKADTIRTTSPSLEDLFNASAKEYLDVLENSHPRNPDDRCSYERASRQAGGRRTVYARVVHRNGETALQYWFFYYFDDWTNRHEGDWELVQLLFRSASAQDIVSHQLVPYSVDYSQHTSGRRYRWSDVATDAPGSMHPVIYVGAGSHANYVEPGYWYTAVKWLDVDVLGGCDLAPSVGEARRLSPADDDMEGHYKVELVTSPSSATDPSAWTPFRGAWGELSIPGFTGPDAPFFQSQGRDPWAWEKGLESGPPEPCVRREGGQRSISPGHDLLEDLKQVTVHPAILAGDLVTFVVTWGGSDVSVTLTSPSGTKFTSPDRHGDGYLAFQIKNAERGTWQMDIVPHFPNGPELVTWETWDLPPACTNALRNDPNADSDLDGLTNADEIARGLDPCNWDSDRDGLPDGVASSPVANIALTLSPDVVECDGAQTADVSVHATDQNGASVPDGTLIEFRSATGGVLSAERAETKSGVATVTAMPSKGVTRMQVDARGGSISATGTIRCAAGIYLRLEPPTVSCDGKNSSTLTATILADAGEAVPDGTAVTFTIVALGTANPINAQTSGGEAATVITPLSDASAGATIIVSANGAQASARLNCG